MPTPRKLNFDDLEFSPISEGSRTLKATLQFKNKYGCNVYQHSPNTNKWLPYEFELLYENQPVAHNQISDEPVGYCSRDDISDFLRTVQSLCTAPR